MPPRVNFYFARKLYLHRQSKRGYIGTMQTHPHATVIDAITVPKLVRAFGLSRQNIGVWRNKGIPAKYWHDLVPMARMHGVEVTTDRLAMELAQTRAP